MNTTIKNRALATFCGLSLALTGALGVAAPAMAATTGTTDVTLEADDSNLNVTVPTTIPMVVQADGTMVGPSAEALTITNNSQFGVHVETVTAQQESPFVLVADASASDEANAFDMQLGPIGDIIDLSGATGGTSTTGANWDMGHADADGDTDMVQLTVAGDAANLTQDISTAQKAATISFSIEAGAND